MSLLIEDFEANSWKKNGSLYRLNFLLFIAHNLILRIQSLSRIHYINSNCRNRYMNKQTNSYTYKHTSKISARSILVIVFINRSVDELLVCYRL